jgi:hypothetical protein
MTLAVRVIATRRKYDCVEVSVYDKDSCPWILGSSYACPRMTGGEKHAPLKAENSC